MKKELPSGWKEFALKDVCDIQDGIHTTPNYVDKGIKFISVENINNIYASNKFISNEDYNNLYKVKAKKNDIFMTRIGDIGTPAIVTKDEELAYYVTLTLLTNIVKEIYYKYLYYAIQSHNFQKELHSRTLHVAFPKKINLGEIGECKFISPPLDEQKRIADILSTFDDLIENLTKLIEKKELYKKGVMQRVLSGDVRFNGFTDEWKTVKLSSVVKIQSGYAFKSNNFKKSGIPVIRISNISNYDNYMDIDEVVYHDEIEDDKLFSIYKNDILIAMSGATTGKTSIYNLDSKSYLNQRVGLFRIIDKEKIDNVFLSQYIFSNYFSSQLKPFLIGGAQPNISSKDIETIIIPLPSIEEQKKIGELLSLIDQDIDNLKQILKLRKLQKKGVMQKLLTGEVRV